MYQPLGLRWEETAAASTDQQQELINPKLAVALRTKTKFQPREWRDFGINNLSPATFIRVTSDSGDQYFKPAVELSHLHSDEDPRDKNRWLALPGAQQYFDGAAMWNKLLKVMKTSTERYEIARQYHHFTSLLVCTCFFCLRALARCAFQRSAILVL